MARKAGANIGAIRTALRQEGELSTRSRLAAEGRQGFAPIKSRTQTRKTTDGPVLDPRFAKNYRRRIQEKDEAGFSWIVPTNTSNPARPRTLEAGYNPKIQELRVIFRDGTPWVYQGVEPVVWNRFKNSPSPGRFINAELNRYPYQRGDFER